MLNPQIHLDYLSTEEYNQYSRQLVLENIGINGQKRLKQAKILIVGAGGLGCPAILYLTASGIGNIGIIDNDKIDLSNLNRQIIYNIENIGDNKVNCSKLKMQKLNRKCNIKTYNYKLTMQNANSIIKKYDIIIDATDNFQTRYLIDEICYKLHKIHIYGAINKYEGQISIFNYKNKVRYSDIYPKNLQLQDNNCNDLGIIGTMTGMIAILQATESIKIILGIGKLLNGKLLIYNFLNTSFKKITLHPIKQFIHKLPRFHTFHHMSLFELNKLNYINNMNLICIDVRDDNEFMNQHMRTSINIPLRLFQYKKTITFIIAYFKHKRIIIYCNTISRSTTASHILNSYSIKNSILQS